MGLVIREKYRRTGFRRGGGQWGPPGVIQESYGSCGTGVKIVEAGW